MQEYAVIYFCYAVIGFNAQLQNEVTKCEVCKQEVLLRLYTIHIRTQHNIYTRRCLKESTDANSVTEVNTEDNESCFRGSRAAAQKYVQ